MTTPFRRHQERVRQEQQQAAARAAIESADAEAVTELTTTAEGFETLCMSLEQDRVLLSGQSLEEKVAFKAERYPVYMEHVAEYRKQGDVYANPVLVEMMIWCFDLLIARHPAGNAVQFKELALQCIAEGQKLPERFTSKNVATFVADAVLQWAQQQVKLQHSPEPMFSDVFALLPDWPVPQPVRMKYHKLAGQLASDAEQWETAYVQLTKADMLGTPQHPAKITTLKKKVVKELEKQGKDLPSVDDDSKDADTE